MAHVMRKGVICIAAMSTLFLSLNIAAAEDNVVVVAATTSTASPMALTAALDVVQVVTASSVASVASLMGTQPLDSKVLAKKRGTADVYNDMQLKGVVADNRAVNVATGNNLITEGAFSGAAGVPMVVQNSGNNVLIQNATILNIQVK